LLEWRAFEGAARPNPVGVTNEARLPGEPGQMQQLHNADIAADTLAANATASEPTSVDEACSAQSPERRELGERDSRVVENILHDAGDSAAVDRVFADAFAQVDASGRPRGHGQWLAGIEKTLDLTGVAMSRGTDAEAQAIFDSSVNALIPRLRDLTRNQRGEVMAWARDLGVYGQAEGANETRALLASACANIANHRMEDGQDTDDAYRGESLDETRALVDRGPSGARNMAGIVNLIDRDPVGLYGVMQRVDIRSARDPATGARAADAHRTGDHMTDLNEALLHTTQGAESLVRSRAALAEHAVAQQDEGCEGREAARGAFGSFLSATVAAAREHALDERVEIAHRAEILGNIQTVLGATSYIGSGLDFVFGEAASDWEEDELLRVHETFEAIGGAFREPTAEDLEGLVHGRQEFLDELRRDSGEVWEGQTAGGVDGGHRDWYRLHRRQTRSVRRSNELEFNEWRSSFSLDAAINDAFAR